MFLLSQIYWRMRFSILALTGDPLKKICMWKKVKVKSLDKKVKITFAIIWWQKEHQNHQNIFRYLDFHLDHSNGRIFQYVNEHVNAYEQVLLCIIFYIVSFEVNSYYFPKEGCFPCKCLWTGVLVHNFDSIMLALRVILIIFPRKDVYV